MGFSVFQCIALQRRSSVFYSLFHRELSLELRHEITALSFPVTGDVQTSITDRGKCELFLEHFFNFYKVPEFAVIFLEHLQLSLKAFQRLFNSLTRLIKLTYNTQHLEIHSVREKIKQGQ